MEENLNIFENGGRPQFFQLEDDLHFVLGTHRKLILVCNIFLTQLDVSMFLLVVVIGLTA